MLALIVPSVLLTTLAFQALDAEARVRESDRALGLQRRAEGIVRELDGVVREPARQLRQQVEERARSATRSELVTALGDRVQHDPQLTGFILFDARGERVVPVPSPPVAERRLESSLGGLLGAALARSPERLVEGARRLLPDQREDALALLRQAERTAKRPACRSGVLLELGRAYASGPRLRPSDQLNALESFGRLREYALDLSDSWGRPAAGLGHLEQVALLVRIGNQVAAQRELTALLSELETHATQLSTETLGELSEGVVALAALAGDAGAAERAQLLVSLRQASESNATRLEELFGRSVRDAEASLPLFLKQRVGGRHAYALTATSPQGAVIFGLDPDVLERLLTDHLGRVQRAAVLAADEGAAAAAQELSLRPPFEHVRIEVSPEAPVTGEEGELEPHDMRLALIVLSMVTIAIGVGVTIRAVRREAKVAQLKTDWVANVTHELKTPLTSIRMFLETLILGRVDDEQEAQECLQVMSREAERLTRLIEQMLVFSRIESRKGRLRLVSTEVRRIVDDALRILTDQFGIDAEFEVVTVQELPPIVVDRFALTEAVLNLLHNAWKYSANTGRDRVLRVVLAARRKTVEIAVEDNGIGVPSRDRKRIFVKFERGTNAELERVEGSGIGLTMANTIVRAHGGWIRYSQLKLGSRFTIHLPK